LNERNSLTSLFRRFSNAHPAVAVCDSDKVLMKARQGRKGTDQGAAKMSIDTGKKKDLGLSQTFAQWFAPESGQICPPRINLSPVTQTASLKLISIDLELLPNRTAVGKDQQFCVDVNRTRMEASLWRYGTFLHP
jgi:hypothetical protein